MNHEQGIRVRISRLGSTGSHPRRLRSSPLGPTLAVLLAAALFGTTGTALAMGPDGVDALSAGSLRLLIGGAGLCLIAGRRLKSNLQLPDERRSRLVLLGGLTVASYQLGFFWATQTTGVALATVLTIGTSPLISRVIGSARGRPSPDLWWIVSAFGLIIGLTLLVIGSSNEGNRVEFDVLGVLSALLAGASYAAYTEVGAEMLVRGWHPTSTMAAMFFSAGLLTSPLLIARDVTWLGSTSGVVMIVHLSFVTLTLSYVWFGSALERLPPTTVVMLTMFEPVVAAILAIVVLDETLTGMSWIGMVVVLVGLMIVGLRSRPAGPATVAP